VSAVTSRLSLLGAALLAGCLVDDRSFGGFDGPADLAFLPPGEFFEVPVAVVTNFRSGRVAKIDLKRTSLLVEDSPAAWMPGPDLPFGADRALGAVALAVFPDNIDVWAADEIRDQLVRAPWISGRDGDGKPVFSRSRLVGTGWTGTCPEPSLAGLRVRSGRAATETWTLTWHRDAWVLDGPTSGLQSIVALPGVPVTTDRGELAFTMAHHGCDPDEGDQLTVEIDNGLEVADVGGYVTDLYAEPEGRWIFASVLPDSGPGFISVWDALTFVELDRLVLPAGATPERISAGATEGTVWVADSADVAGLGRIFRLDWVPGDLDTLAATALAAPEPVIDVAEGRDPDSPRLFVASAFSRAIWSLDPVTGEVLDTNPTTPEVDPTYVATIVSGLAATEVPIVRSDFNEVGTPLESHGVVASVVSGLLYWLDAGTGCLEFNSPAGAYRDSSFNNSVSLFTDLGAQSDPAVVTDDSTGRFVATHPCGGVAVTETWTLRFDAEAQSYEVEGSRSGVQEARLFEGVRYVSDTGAMSLMVMPGTRPTTDGDRFRFQVEDGIAPIALQELPGDPIVYTEQYDERSGPYYKVKQRPIALVPHEGNDTIMWIDITGQGAGLRGYE